MSIPKVHPNPSAVKPEASPSHPYGLCQCTGKDCIECLREENQALRDQLDEANQRWMLIAVPAMREGQLLREELLEQQKSLRHRRLIPAHHVESLVLQ